MGNTIASCLCSKNTAPPISNVKIDQSDQIFPNGVMIEIMTRLPLKSLARCNLVCKDWQSLIHNHYLTEMHMAHRHTAYPYHNQPNSRPVKSRRRKSFIYEHGCNGLLLMLNVKDGKPYVWNPAIRRLLKLPSPHGASLGFAFSYVPATKTYRIVSFYDNGNLGCEVFTPSHDKAWRHLPEIPNFLFSSNGKEERVSVVSAGGAVHCVVVTSFVDRETSVEVVSLDLETEEFTASRLPGCDQLGDWKNYWDVDWDGKLGIVDVVGQNMEVLELEDYKKGKWSEKKRIISLGSFLKGDEEVIPLLAMKGEIWLWLKGREIITYTIATGERTVRKKSKTYAVDSKLYPYKPSLISFQGMVPDKKLEDYRLSFFSS